MKLSHPLLSLALAAALVGCAPLKVRPPSADLPMGEKAAREAAAAEWLDPAVTREGAPMMVLATPTNPPEAILKRQIKLELDSGATVHDVVAVLANLGYSVIITDKEAAETPILAPRYHGTLGGLLSSLRRAADVWTVWENDALVVSKLERIVLSLPQERKLATRIAAGLQDLGICVTASKDSGVSKAEKASDGQGDGKTSSSDSNSKAGDDKAGGPKCSTATRKAGDPGVGAAAWEAGMISLYVSPSEYQRALTFLERITQNAAIVNLQIAMVSVSTNQDVSRGMDWSKLQLAIGGDHHNLLDTLKPKNSTGDTDGGEATDGMDGTDTPNSSTGSTDEPSLPDTGRGVLTAEGAMRAVLSRTGFSMIGFLDFLDKYGQTKTLQSVMLRTVTGSEVQLKSVTEIPYVTGVGIGQIGATSGGVGTTSNVGQANTDKANDGITLKMLPSYDAASHSVTIDMSLSIEAVLAFNELSAGNQLGKLTQPTTAERTFNDVIRVRPGQTVVVGGISYDQVQRDNNVPLYMPDATGHKSLKVKRESMFIVVRPTVTVLGALQVDAADEAAAEKQGRDTTAEPAQPAAE